MRSTQELKLVLGATRKYNISITYQYTSFTVIITHYYVSHD